MQKEKLERKNYKQTNTHRNRIKVKSRQKKLERKKQKQTDTRRDRIKVKCRKKNQKERNRSRQIKTGIV